VTILWIYIAFWKGVKKGAWREGVVFDWISIQNWDKCPTGIRKCIGSLFFTVVPRVARLTITEPECIQLVDRAGRRRLHRRAEDIALAGSFTRRLVLISSRGVG
jgi:hypothetical protein